MKVPVKRIVSMDGDVFGHFLLSSVTLMWKDKYVEVPNSDEYEVTLTINGVELPVEEVFMEWHNKLESSVERRAEQLFAEKFREVGNILSDLCPSVGDEDGRHLHLAGEA